MTYDDLVAEMVSSEQVQTGRWFSLPCLKANGYIFAALWLNGDMVFKLWGKAHQEAMALPGAKLFDPLDKNRPMKEWVQVPAQHHNQWRDLAQDALEYTRTLPPKIIKRKR